MEERTYTPESEKEAKRLHARIRNGCIGGLLGIGWGNLPPISGSFFEFIRIQPKIAHFDVDRIGELLR